MSPPVPLACRTSGVRPIPLEAALNAESWPVDGRRPPRDEWRLPEERRLRTVIEALPGEDGIIRTDQPVGAAFLTRVFGPRAVRYDTMPRPGSAGVESSAMAKGVAE